MVLNRYYLLVAVLLDDAEPRHTRQLAHRGVDGRVGSDTVNTEYAAFFVDCDR